MPPPEFPFLRCAGEMPPWTGNFDWPPRTDHGELRDAREVPALSRSINESLVLCYANLTKSGGTTNGLF